MAGYSQHAGSPRTSVLRWTGELVCRFGVKARVLPCAGSVRGGEDVVGMEVANFLVFEKERDIDTHVLLTVIYIFCDQFSESW